jgi:RNA-directed DNA polymerase
MLDRSSAPDKPPELPFAPRRGDASAGASGGATLVGDDTRMEHVVERTTLWAAQPRVKTNGGSPGLDGMTVEEWPGHRQQHGPAIRASLLAGTYRPSPGKRVESPKPEGGVRQLGIPTGLDQFIEQARLQRLQPEGDGTFAEPSDGFRPGRSALQAVARAQQDLEEGYAWVVDLDREQFFDPASCYSCREPGVRPGIAYAVVLTPGLAPCHGDPAIGLRPFPQNAVD